MQTETRELYCYITGTEPFKSRYENLSTEMASVTIAIRGLVKDAIGQYGKDYGNGNGFEIFSDEDFKNCVNEIINDIKEREGVYIMDEYTREFSLDCEDLMVICRAVYDHWIDGRDESEDEKYKKYPWLEFETDMEDGYIQEYANRVLPNFIKLYKEEGNMSRIDNIVKFAQKREEEKMTKEQELKQELDGCKTEIAKLKPRIDELISVANACIENGIDIDGYRRGFGRSYDTWGNGTFVTNSISHKVGFVFTRQNKITLMGINAGGACGRWDFRTNGENTFSANEDDSTHTKEPLLHHCKEFLEKFDEFETAFYNYIDKITQS